MVTTVLEGHGNIASSRDDLTADAIADGIGSLLALLRFVALLLWRELIELPLITAPDVDLAHLSGRLRAAVRLQAEEDLLQPTIPFAGALFQHMQLLPILWLVVPLRLGAAPLCVELAAVKFALALPQDHC